MKTRFVILLAFSLTLSAFCGLAPVRLQIRGVRHGVFSSGATTSPSPSPAPAAVGARGESEALLVPPGAGLWLRGEALRGSFFLPSGHSPSRLLVFLSDRDGHWFQALLPGLFGVGTNSWSVPFSAGARDVWRPVGHNLVWNHRSRLCPRFVGLRVFPERGGGGGEPPCVFLDAFLVPSPPPAGRPVPSQVRLSTPEPACFSMLEASFRLPDRYDNPFDPDEIDVSAEIERPDGRTATTPAFYTQDFYDATDDATGGSLTPDGAPGWRVRYAPVVPGPHVMRILATDRAGAATSAPASFVAAPADGPAYVTTSSRSPFRFQAGGAGFFPVGHNIRSPFDTRYDDQHPWKARLPEGYAVYKRYFDRMAGAGENIAEVWMCQWSLGLEWSTNSPGYHGVGDYNLGNAWRLDRVLGFARESGVRVNLVLNNHGRASLFSDEEWRDSPYNEMNGGSVPRDDPIRFFTDPRAIALQKRICRYVVARWGWSPSVFAFELWSELDLCGNGKGKVRAHDDPDVIGWHRELAAYIKSIDPNRHLVSTHISGNYRNARPALLRVPELDHCCIDAYHGSADPFRITGLLTETAEFYRRFGKPVLVTEFGGSALGAGVGHISAELHAALWTSACTTLGGAPLLWWWGLIDEQDLYREFTPLREFMADAPYQDPALAPATLAFSPPEGDGAPAGAGCPLSHVASSSGTNLIAWIYRPGRLAERYYGTSPRDAAPAGGTVEWGPVSSGVYRVVQCDTKTGRPVRIQDYRTTDEARAVGTDDGEGDTPRYVPSGRGTLRFKLEPFECDCAIKATPR